jgi:hypothetical protein
MPKTVFLKFGDTPKSVALRHFLNFSEADCDRLTKETAELIQYGELIGGQGGSYKSKRTVHLSEKTVILDARFGALGLLVSGDMEN